MDLSVFSRALAKRLIYLFGGAALFGLMLSAVLANALPDSGETRWSDPRAMALRRVSPLTSAQSEPGFMNNIDCAPLTYRMVSSRAMQTGCFTETAFGLFDSDSSIAIFNGTDEGVPLQTYMLGQVLAPWPQAGDLISLGPASTGGTLISLYKDPLASIQDLRNALGQLVAKQLTKPPDLSLKDNSGKSFVINPQTLAFSEGGAWVVAETLNGSFIRINLATLTSTAFANSYGSQGSPALLKSRVAVSGDGKFVAIVNEVAEEFKVYDLSSCTATCQSYDYWPYVQQQIGNLQMIRHVRFINSRLLSFDATARDTADSGTYELAPAASIDALTDYIALGDSYTSGEGAFDYLDGTDAQNNLCHVSRHSYPLLLSHDVFSGAGGHSVACSGAVIRDIGDTSSTYKGQAKDVPGLDNLQQTQPLLLETVESHFVPGYVSQQRFIARWQPRITTVGIGGNDIGFGHIVQNCVMPHISLSKSGNTCYKTYEDRLELIQLIDRTEPRLTSLYRQLQRQAPETHIYAIGYPQVSVSDGACAMNVHLDRQELELAEDIVNYLNQTINRAASAAGVQYVDISQALAGHRLCETASYNVAVNGLTAGLDAGNWRTGPIGKESYHPNAFGHLLIEQAILRQTNSFRSALSGFKAASEVPGHLLDAPRSGRPINILVPDNNLSVRQIVRGGNLNMHSQGNQSGLRPLSAYTVRLDGPVGAVLGTINSSSSGNLEGKVQIPDVTEPGGHTIDITGPSQTETSLDIRQPIYVQDSEADSDRDGNVNSSDSCPAAIDSGRDDDRDGTDDTCDPAIAFFAAPGSGPGNAEPLSLSKMYLSSGQPGNSHGSGSVLGFGLPLGHQPYSTFAAAGPAVTYMKQFLAGLLLILFALSLLAKTYIQNSGFGLQWVHMSRVRKGFVYFLSLFLLAALIGTAVATSTNNTLGKPKKVESYLEQSKIYDHFITYTTDQAKKANGDHDQSDSVSLSDAAIKAAAESSFTSDLIKDSVNKVIDANYAWLEGKTETPSFMIDLASEKQSFAEKVGKYVTTYTAGLPVCTSPEIAAQQAQNLLVATCRPAELSPEAAGAQVAQNLSASGDFLSNPVVTPKNINPENNPNSEPYYEKLSQLPKAYQLGMKLPYIFAGLSVLAAISVVFLSENRRKGLRRVGIVLLIAGISLVALKFFADLGFRKVEGRIFNNANVGQLQQSLTDFVHRIETAMVRTDLWFGIGFLLLAAVIFGALAATRHKDSGGEPSAGEVSPYKGGDGDDDASEPLILSRKRLQRRPLNDLTPRARPKTEEEKAAPQPKPKKRRLIQ